MDTPDWILNGLTVLDILDGFLKSSVNGMVQRSVDLIHALASAEEQLNHTMRSMKAASFYSPADLHNAHTSQISINIIY